MAHPTPPWHTQHHHGTSSMTTGHPALPWDIWHHHGTAGTTTGHLAPPWDTQHHHGTPGTTMGHPASPRDTQHYHRTSGTTMGHPAPPWDTRRHHGTPSTATGHQAEPRHTWYHHNTPGPTTGHPSPHTAHLALPWRHGHSCSPAPAPRHWVPTPTGCDKPGAGGWPGSCGWGWWVLIAPSSSCVARAGVGPGTRLGAIRLSHGCWDGRERTLVWADTRDVPGMGIPWVTGTPRAPPWGHLGHRHLLSVGVGGHPGHGDTLDIAMGAPWA